MMKLPITVIIPTYNEGTHVARAINCVKDYVDQVLVADSFSSDHTLPEAKNALDSVSIINVAFTTFASKMNTALKSPLIRNAWVMRLDADEVVSNPEEFFDVLRRISEEDNIGYYCNRRYYFLGHWVKHGGMYPRKVLRIFKKGFATFEDRMIDEKMLVTGPTGVLNVDIADVSLMGLGHWVEKHIAYARREAVESIKSVYVAPKSDLPFDLQIRERKRMYYHLPIFLRPMLYFLYRIIAQRGAADGFVGIFYHFMHAFVYREMVDVYILRNKLTNAWNRE